MNPTRPTLISFYCGDPYYARTAAALRQRCDSLGMPIVVEEAADAGTYWRNTLHKPIFILDKLSTLRRDLIWIDADTQLHEDHEAFRVLSADLTLASHTGDLSGMKASPIGLAYNARTLAVVTAWAQVCQSRLASGDIDLDHDVLKFDILPAFVGKLSLRLMGDAAQPRQFTHGSTLSNGLSGNGRAATAHVLHKNRRRCAPFAALRLEHFMASD